jgi:hypothetical protein
VLAGRTAELPGLLPDLAYAMLLPYLGPKAAEREATRARATYTPRPSLTGADEDLADQAAGRKARVARG